jgi:oxygen-independent coproporphyrinogen-3 oxidase
MPGLYVHVPFCRQACSYCDFYFVTRQELLPDFVRALRREILAWEGHPATRAPVESLYFGGGTPSLLSSEDMDSILKTFSSVFSLSLKEFTLEANPENLDPGRLSELKSLGVNRLSLGVQSFDPALLGSMHRSHTARQAEQALHWTAEAGFRSWSADLIFANPGQSLCDLDRDLDRMLQFAPPHLSAYSLTLEEKTRLHKQVALGRVAMPEPDDAASHLSRVCERLEEAGYERYEVSSHAIPGHRALHNARYWTHAPYIGFGPAAHSFLWTGQSAGPPSAAGRASTADAPFPPPSFVGTPVPGHARGLRWSAPRDLRAWMQGSADPEHEWLSGRQLAEERILLGLRTVEGISRSELAARYGHTFSPAQESRITRWIESGLAVETASSETAATDAVRSESVTSDRSIRLTREGLNVADRLTLDLLA